MVHGLGWREYALVDAGAAATVDPAVGAASAYLGALGMTGPDRLRRACSRSPAFKPGDTVFVSGAAGAVGSVVGQIAKARARPGSSAAPARRRRWRCLPASSASTPRSTTTTARWRSSCAAAAPDGIDVYFDNVGGEHLEAAIVCAAPHGRVALCGAIAAYNATEPPAGPRNLALAIGKRLTHARLPGRRPLATCAGVRRARSAAGWPTARCPYDETVVDGLENAPQAFIGLLAAPTPARCSSGCSLTPGNRRAATYASGAGSCGDRRRRRMWSRRAPATSR